MKKGKNFPKDKKAHTPPPPPKKKNKKKLFTTSRLRAPAFTYFILFYFISYNF